MTWIGARGLFAIVYTTSVASVYFALGVVAGRALGLTPLVFLVGGLFFGLAGMTYAEGAAGHPEAGGSTVFARYAFNELVSFVTGWAVILDYVIVLAATALAATGYLGTLWSPAGSGLPRFGLAAAIVAFVVVANVRGLSPFRLSRRVLIAFGDIAVQVLVVVLGLALVFHPGALADSVDLGTTPTWSDLVFALTLVTVAFTGLEAAASLSAEVRIERRELRRLMGGGVAVIVLVYLGISLVAISALPVVDGRTALGGRWEDAPLVGVVRQFDPHWLAEAMGWIVAVSGTVALVAAANSAMLGVSRLAYSLATNRQIPSALGRLSQRFGTPWVLIALSGLLAVALLIPTDLEFLVGIYAFGAMLAFTIAHVSIVRLRYREPDRRRAFRVPLSVRVGRAEVPLPAAFGAALSARRVGQRARAPRGGALRRPDLDGVRPRALRRLSPWRRQAAAGAGHDPGAGAALRDPRPRVRLDPRADLRRAARRRHRADRGPARRADARRERRRGRRHDRGHLGLRGAALASARRAAARRAGPPRARGAGAGEVRGGGVRGRAGADRDDPRPSRRAGASSTRPGGAASRRSSSPRRSPRGSAAGRCSAGPGARWTTPWARSRSTSSARRSAG